MKRPPALLLDNAGGDDDRSGTTVVSRSTGDCGNGSRLSLIPSGHERSTDQPFPNPPSKSAMLLPIEQIEFVNAEEMTRTSLFLNMSS